MKQYTYHFHAISTDAASGQRGAVHTDGIVNASEPITTPEKYRQAKIDICRAMGLKHEGMVLTALSVLNISIK